MFICVQILFVSPNLKKNIYIYTTYVYIYEEHGKQRLQSPEFGTWLHALTCANGNKVIFTRFFSPGTSTCTYHHCIL